MRLLLAALALLAAVQQAPAMDKAEAQAQFNAMVSDWYAALKQPDYVKSSCCGDGDAYYADKVDECSRLELEYDKTCALVAIVTDTRPDRIVIPARDGKPERVIVREHIPVGTRMIVPRKKLRSPPSANPTDHNIIFISSAEGVTWTLCWEPTGGI